MELERRSSGTAKAGLATGIVGTALGTIGILGGGANMLGNLTGWGRNNNGYGETVVMPMPVPMMGGFGYGCGWGGDGFGYGRGYSRNSDGACCSEDRVVNRYELELTQKLAEKDSAIALRDANTYQDQKMLEMYKYVDGRFREFEDALCKQAVTNQATADSFQLVRQEQECCCDKVNMRIDNEAHERRCADNAIVNYANNTFYPKMVADVTTGTTTTAQRLYNPLPCACNCDNNGNQQ